MKCLFRLYLVTLVGIFCLQPDFAMTQSYEVTAFWEMDIPPEEGWHVGDQIPLRLHVNAPEDVQVDVAELPKQWGTFEIQKQSVVEPGTSGEYESIALELTVQLWEVGSHETPETLLMVQREKEDPAELVARPLIVDIVSVLPEGGNGDAIAKRDLKPQADLPKPPLWPWLLAGLCATPLLYLAGRWLWHKIPQRHNPIPEQRLVEIMDNRFPEDIAYGCLDRIARMDLPGIGAIKQHYTLVTDCLRHYLRGVYSIPAMDMTTSELRRALRKLRIDAETLRLLWELLDQADMVKFAKLHPDVAQARDIVRWGRHFVDCTKPHRQSESVAIQRVA